jgi:hypothetical protein
MAADSSANVSAQTKLMDHGTLVSDDTTLGIGLRFNDVLAKGAFVRANFDSISDVTPLNDSVTFRSDIGAGFTGTLAGNTWELSANRVMNPVIYADDYSEARARLTRGPLFVELNQGLTTGINKDTYIAAGIQQSFGGLTVGGLVSTVRYNNDALQLRDEFEYNNAEVFARYNVWQNLDVNVNYSKGGLTATGEEIDNQVWGGLNYRF